MLLSLAPLWELLAVSVVGAGFVLMQLDQPALSEKASVAAALAVGVMTMSVGVRMFRIRWRAVSAEDTDIGKHLFHGDGHGDRENHVHPLGKPRGVGVKSPQSEVIRPSQLRLMAVAGGVLPSPPALVVVLAAFGVGKADLGVALVLCFSVGIAATLTGIGVLLVRSKAFVARSRVSRYLPYLPVIGATWLIVIGAAISWRSVVAV